MPTHYPQSSYTAGQFCQQTKQRFRNYHVSTQLPNRESLQSVRGHPNSVPPMPHASNDVPGLLSLCVNTAVNKVIDNKSTFPVEPMTFTPHTRRADRVCDGLSRSGGIGKELGWWLRGSRAGAEDRQRGLSLRIACYVRSKICPDKFGRTRVLTSCLDTGLKIPLFCQLGPVDAGYPMVYSVRFDFGITLIGFYIDGSSAREICTWILRFHCLSICRKVNRVLGSKSKIDS